MFKIWNGTRQPSRLFEQAYTTQWKSVSQSKREESNDFSKLLYTLYVTPVLDALGIGEIAEHAQTDTKLTKLKDLIIGSKIYIPKNLPELQPFRSIFSEITELNNGTLLKQEKIVLPASLVNKSLSLADSGAHPGRNGLIRRLRTHFFIKGLDKIVEELVNN